MAKVLRFVEPTFDYSKINAESQLVKSATSIRHDVYQYHTSLADLTAEQVIALAPQFDLIELLSEHHDQQSALYRETLILLHYLSHRIKVLGLPHHDAKRFVSGVNLNRSSDQPLLWVFGCSHTHGVGLPDQNQRYANQMARLLDLPVRVIAQPGASIDWTLRHLISSRISPQDTVVWQLTTATRFSKLKQFDGQCREFLLKDGDRTDVLYWTDEQLYLKQLSCLAMGMSLLRTIGCKSILTSLNGQSNLDYYLMIEYAKYPEYCYLPNMVVDLGTDNLHFGPRTHDRIAMGLIQHLNTTYA